MLEIDVDVGSLIALAADEALEEHVHALGIDGRHAQAIADGGIGGRAAALAENVARASKSHEVPDSEKVGFVAQLGDERQFVLKELADFGRDAGRITVASAFPSQMCEIFQRRLA